MVILYHYSVRLIDSVINSPIAMKTLIIPLCITSLFASSLAQAQNPNYTPGDLVLYFQQEGGTNTVYANLGDSALLFRGATAGPGAANRLNFLDINAALTTAFGADWASDDRVYAGLAGVWGQSTSATASGNLQNGDPNRTIYVSASRTGVGAVGQAQSLGYTINTNTGTITCSARILSQNQAFELNYQSAVVVSPTSVSTIDEQNPFTVPGLQGPAFNTFGGGVQQKGAATPFGSVGPAGSVEFALDLYRILAITTAPGQVAGDLRVGSFEGTVTINSAGSVSFISQGSATPFQTWANSFPALDTEAKRALEADSDNDGLNNLLEFVLDGNPSSSDSAAVVPTLISSGSNFDFAFKRRDDSEATATVTFQYSSDLVTWTDVAVGAESGTVGAAEITVGENAASSDAILVSLPKTATTSGKLFGRLKANP
jgi:hypothetical protein